MESSSEGFYSQPKYYDILFGWDRSEEFLFVDGALRKHGLECGQSLLECACGTGSVSLNLSALGWEMTGLDSSSEMLSAMEDKFSISGRQAQTIRADMSDFHSEQRFSGAYCPLGSIGLLHQDEQLISHLHCIAEVLRENGIYLIDLGLHPEVTTALDVKNIEWGMESEGIVVEAIDGTVHVDDPQVPGGPMSFPWDAVPLEFHWPHFKNLIERSKAFQLEAFYPEAEKNDMGISLFNTEREGFTPECERAMVLLRKC
jgi:SAM-dependent methyltransferase